MVAFWTLKSGRAFGSLLEGLTLLQLPKGGLNVGDLGKRLLWVC